MDMKSPSSEVSQGSNKHLKILIKAFVLCGRYINASMSCSEVKKLKFEEHGDLSKATSTNELDDILCA